MHLLTLIVGTVLLPTVYTLKCYECPVAVAGTCTETQKQCPSSSYQCSAVKMAVYAGGSQLSDVAGKSCALPEECVSASVNLGVSKVVVSSSCCTTDLCNNRPAPDITNMRPNGNKCFTCNGQTKQCTATLNCEGSEDHCITATVNTGSEKVRVKGCATKEVCSSSQSISVMQSMGTDISCCQGNFCNSGSSTSAGLLLLVAPLSYFIIFS